MEQAMQNLEESEDEHKLISEPDDEESETDHVHATRCLSKCQTSPSELGVRGAGSMPITQCLEAADRYRNCAHSEDGFLVFAEPNNLRVSRYQ